MTGSIDLFDISYLRDGTASQRDAHRAITELGILRDLAEYTPALAGTVPLDIDIDGSDLDIICSTNDLGAFAAKVEGLYGSRDDFQLARFVVRDVDSVVGGFRYAGWWFELFAQPTPTARQYACLHLLVEARLLAMGGVEARNGIRDLKRLGMKTEPAFAHYFGLQGDAYLTLAVLAETHDLALRAALTRGTRP